APKMRAVRARIEQGAAQPTEYPTAVLDEQPFVRYPHSTIAYISADLSKLKKTAAGKLRVKVGVLPASMGAIVDDFLGANDGTWFSIDPRTVPYTEMVETVSTAANASSALTFKSAGLDNGLVVFLPQNSKAAGQSVLLNANGSLVR